jgi:Zn-dependent peptidase ImmA (M78 family)/transcriptional regulator with XRE-family HTH domain
MASTAQIGERIAAARKRAQLTQAQLAGALGLARTTVVAMEKGERAASSEELLKLAAALSIELNDLLREHVVLAQVSPRFRAGGAEVDAVIARLLALAEQYAELEQVARVVRTPAPLESLASFRALSFESVAAARNAGQDAAGFLRRMLGLGDGPAASLQPRLELEAGLRIFTLQMPVTISAVLIWSDQVGACVGLNRDESPERQRWSLLHELGHFLLDREAGDVLRDTVRKQDAGEAFCEALAGEFLLPAAGLRRAFLEHLRERGRQHFPIADLSALARLYEVSIGRMALRLEELQLLPSGTYDGLRKKTFKANEPVAQYGLKAGPAGLDLPQRYRRLAFELFAEGSLSEAELAKFLHTDRMQSRRGYLEWLAQLDEGGALDVDPGASLAKVR